jgi:hypothetical protein
MTKLVRMIVLVGLALGSSGLAVADVGGTNPVPRPPQSQTATAAAAQIMLSLLGL